MTGRPRRRASLLRATLLVVALSGCTPVKLDPPETFQWRGMPVTFSPPLPIWRREEMNQGGWLGVSFVLTGSVGERIIVADYYVVADRDRDAALGELLAKMDDLEPRPLLQAISIARWRTDDPLSPLEAEIAREGNIALDRAMAAVVDGDRAAARRAIESARRNGQRMKLDLYDVVERVRFRPERHSHPEQWKVRAEERLQVAGEPALRVDYTWQPPERTYHGREVYVVHGNHLFTASFHGLEKNLKLFDRLLESLSFPATADEAPAVTP